MDHRSRLAVREFLLRVKRELGSERALAVRVSSYDQIYQVKRGAVGHWITGVNPNVPPAWIVFALAVDLDIGLDDFAFLEARHPLMRELAALDGRMRNAEILLSQILVKARQQGWDIPTVTG